MRFSHRKKRMIPLPHLHHEFSYISCLLQYHYLKLFHSLASSRFTFFYGEIDIYNYSSSSKEILFKSYYESLYFYYSFISSSLQLPDCLISSKVPRIIHCSSSTTSHFQIGPLRQAPLSLLPKPCKFSIYSHFMKKSDCL